MPEDDSIDKLEALRDDIVHAARIWRNSHPGLPGYINDYTLDLNQGYLYDRVRRYEDKLKDFNKVSDMAATDGLEGQ